MRKKPKAILPRYVLDLYAQRVYYIECRLTLATFQSNRILEHTQKIGNGYGFMIFCFYFGFSVLLHLMHYFND